MLVVERHGGVPVAVRLDIKSVENDEPLLPAFSGSFLDLLITDLREVRFLRHEIPRCSNY